MGLTERTIPNQLPKGVGPNRIDRLAIPVVNLEGFRMDGVFQIRQLVDQFGRCPFLIGLTKAIFDKESVAFRDIQMRAIGKIHAEECPIAAGQNWRDRTPAPSIPNFNGLPHQGLNFMQSIPGNQQRIPRNAVEISTQNFTAVMR